MQQLRDSIPDLLLEIPLYRQLAAEDREHLAAVSLSGSYEKGETLFREGDEGETFYTVARGRIKVFKTTQEGRDVILELFGPGDPVGAVAVYQERAYPATAVAIEPTICLETPRRAFFELLQNRPSLVRGLLAALTHRLVLLTSRLADRTSKVEIRFARLFLKLADDLGSASAEGVRIPVALSRQELADLMGTTVETAIRIMSRWGKGGVVLTEKQGFLVTDRRALENLAIS